MEEYYYPGEYIHLTHVYGKKVRGWLGFIENKTIGIYTFLNKIPFSMWTDLSIGIEVGRDRRNPRKDVYLIKIPLDRIKEGIETDTDMVFVKRRQRQF